VILLVAFAPLFLAFEVWQLVLSERYLGIKQIARGADPRSLGLHEITAFFWSVLLFGYWIWDGRGTLLSVPALAAAVVLTVIGAAFEWRQAAAAQPVVLWLQCLYGFANVMQRYICRDVGNTDAWRDHEPDFSAFEFFVKAYGVENFLTRKLGWQPRW